MEFKVANVAAHSHIHTLNVPTSTTPGSLRKTAKHMTFHDPLIDLNQPHCTIPSQGGLRKTATLKISLKDPINSTMNGTQHKKPQNNMVKPLLDLKTPICHAPTTKPKPSFKVKLTKGTSHNLHHYGPGYSCPEVRHPRLL